MAFRIVYLFVLCLITVNAEEQNCNDLIVSLYGTGSSAAAPFYNELGPMFSAKRAHEGQKVEFNYESRSSGYGLARITMSLPNKPPIVFGGSDKVLSEEQQAKHDHIKLFPTMAVAVLIIYNMPEAKDVPLILSGEVISKIYHGEIRQWDHEEIKQLNKNISLTHNRIRTVARGDKSGTTFVFARALEKFDNMLRQQHEAFSNLSFDDGICCNAPPEVIEFLTNGANGMTGVVDSVLYSIGYAFEANVKTNGNIRVAKLVNSVGYVTEANEASVQAAMDYHGQQSHGSMEFDLNNALISNAYPIASFSYMLVNISTHPQISCCQMQELTGFTEYLLNTSSTLFRKHRLVAPSPLITKMVNEHILQTIKCKGNPMYVQYLTSLERKFEIKLWHVILGFSVMLVILFGVIGIYLVESHKRRNADIKKWLMTGHVEFKTECSHDVLEANQNAPMQFHYEQGKLEGMPVWLDQLNVEETEPKNWHHKTHDLVKHFHDDIVHQNVINFIGIATSEGMSYAILDHSTKGSLHYVLQTCKYELNDSIKYNFGLNIAEGLEFLHQKQIVHGQLSSINCFVDNSWTIKISGWYRFEITKKEGSLKDMKVEFAINKSSWDYLFKGIYVDGDFMELKSYSCDIYSFGLLLVEIFTGRLPFNDQAETFIQNKLFKSLQLQQFEINFGDTPLSLQDLVMSCIGGINNRPSATQLCTVINEMKPTSSGIVDVMMEAMETYTVKLEQLVTDQAVLTEQMRDLLNEVLPPEIAIKLLNGENVAPEFFECVTIYFSDIVGFTDISRRSKPLEVMTLLNDLWVLFDYTIQKFDVYKVDTIGDAYMVCSGLPKRNNNEHGREIADLALALLEAVADFKIQHLPNEKLQIRCGINSGQVIAGVVGTKMPQYCVFGDAVNTASRMESTSEPMKIHVSKSTAVLLQVNFPKMYRLKLRGEVEIKGKGKMETYWLDR